MKNTLVILILFLIPGLVFSQDITGQWNGALSVQGMQLRLVFHIIKTESGYSTTMDSPDQGAKGIPVTTTTFDNSKLRLEVAAARIEYSADFKDNTFIGKFKQAGLELPLNLSRAVIEKAVAKRPQEPVKPYPYYTEDVTFSNNKANVTLAGTLTLPQKEGAFPAAIFITGSGPQNRDEELLGHKPFLVLADYLTRHGIAVLRYDDRGVGQSTGDFKTATSADFATDVESAIAYLKTRKEINQNKIGLIGHSEGGLIAPMVAAKNKDLDFIILLAGPGMRGDKLLLMQQEIISKVSGVPDTEIQKNKEVNAGAFQILIQSKDTQTLKADLTKYLEETLQKDPTRKPASLTEAAFIDLQLNQLANPWMAYFVKYDPAPVLEKVKCAVLAVNGSKDLQVPAKENLAAIGKSLQKGGNKKVTLIELPNLNHLFQESTSGLPAEYATLEQTISPTALEKITEWIVKQVQ